MILPQESQFGGTTTLSRSMTLCLSGWRFKREWIPRDECMRLCSGLETEGIVYIREAPSENLLVSELDGGKRTYASKVPSLGTGGQYQTLPLSKSDPFPGLQFDQT